MKKSVLFRLAAALLLAALLFSFAGCSERNSGEGSGREAIPFSDGQLYAVAHLGYQKIEHLEHYVREYLSGDNPPVFYLSSGDYYLVIPRYDGMELKLYENDLNSSQPTLVYEDPDCEPFILQCNASDIFADATIRLTYGDSEAEFSPFLSLKDGSLEIGPGGLELTVQ
ncbi:hypothetical protein [Feifania hominis]|uniref:Lipoprotein n=1 Tax=Feifania hominis TaxID=2763660 RepID=A0A926DFT4_9FIRM|nr:hypothetical protein [Feifania hominis]MBC8536504.1 hypothetical protein [Feifania hominis]